jgi:hypothetical protein
MHSTASILRLLQVGEDMAAGQIEFNDEMHSKKERKAKKKISAVEMNRFRVLVDMLEADLEAFQLCDPQEVRRHYPEGVHLNAFAHAVHKAL